MKQPLRCPVREVRICPRCSELHRAPLEAEHRFETIGVLGRANCPEHRVPLEAIDDDRPK